MSENPFAEVRSGSQRNRARIHFVDIETIEKVLAACPNQKSPCHTTSKRPIQTSQRRRKSEAKSDAIARRTGTHPEQQILDILQELHSDQDIKGDQWERKDSQEVAFYWSILHKMIQSDAKSDVARSCLKRFLGAFLRWSNGRGWADESA